jgi:hypothetical protein
MIPSYHRFVNSPGYDRYQPTHSYFDYFSPGTKFNTTIVTEQESYVIKDIEVLRCQLLEMFNRDLPDILYNGEYISKGVININKMHMYEYLNQCYGYIQIPDKNNANRYLGDMNVINYICWKFNKALEINSGFKGQILGYRFRYIFPNECPFHPIKIITNTIYRNIKEHIICYSYFINPDPNRANALDVIISNAPYKRKHKRNKTLSKYMNYTTIRINNDIAYNMFHYW